MSNTLKFTVVTHFCKYGEEMSDDDATHMDYAAMTIEDQNGKVIKRYEDSYHDKSEEKIEGFIEGIKYITGKKVKIEKKELVHEDDDDLYDYKA